MYFIPLSQAESVDLVIHALRAAGGEADCSGCPAYRVCTRQCLAIAAAVEDMARNGSLPAIELEKEEVSSQESAGPKSTPGLKVIK